VKVGDLVKVKNPLFGLRRTVDLGDDEKKARGLYPWKFEAGIVTNLFPWGAYPGTEAQVYFPSAPEKRISRHVLEVVNESR